MYQYVSSTLKPNGLNQTWQDVDIRSIRLSQLQKEYHSGVVELTHPNIQGSIYVDFAHLFIFELPYLDVEFERWLSTVHPHTIPGHDLAPTFTTKQALYRDAVQANFNITRCHRKYAGSLDLPPSDETDLLLTKDNVPIDLLQSRVLTTVNGILHPNVPSDLGVQILDCAKTDDITHSYDMGVISFSEVGDIHQYPITVDNLNRVNSSVPYYLGCFVTLNQSLKDKSVLVSIAGKLHIEDNVVQIISEDTGVILIDLTRIDLLTLYYDLKDQIDLSSIKINQLTDDLTRIDSHELYHDDNVVSLLTLIQSFIVVVDAKGLHAKRELVHNTNLWGCYESANCPTSLLINAKRCIQEYWCKNEGSSWVMMLANPVKKTYGYQTSLRSIKQLNIPHATPTGYALGDHWLLSLCFTTLTWNDKEPK